MNLDRAQAGYYNPKREATCSKIQFKEIKLSSL